ncbi:MAG: GNAT family N-acetyltransferase [Woeseiaceae bacterium]
MTWFPDRKACLTWGGSQFRFPFTEATFREDAKLNSLPTRVLVRDDGELVAFGQYYLRVGRCHLGRLSVSPALRGQGLGSALIRELSRQGRADLGVHSLSLFVHPDNRQALKLYLRLRFSEVPYPEPSLATDAYIYMVAATPIN